MAPRIQNPAESPLVTGKTTTVQAVEYQPAHADAPIDSDSYWDWPADVVDTDVSESLPESSESEANATADPDSASVDPPQVESKPTTATDDTTAITTKASVSCSASSNDDYWAEAPCCEHKDVDVDYYIDYSSRNILGKGTKTTVRKAICRSTNNRFAVKSVRKVHTKEYQSMKQEASILAELQHENICKCHRIYEDSKSLHLVLDLCKGKEVYEEVALLAKQRKTLPESAAASMVEQVLQAVAHCHARHIVHRDIKLENLMFKSKYKQTHEIRMVDFGLATRFTPGKMLTERAGSPYYVAPEVLEKCYDQSCDIWSIGILTYALLCGEAPFVGSTPAETLDKIRSATNETTAHIFRQAAWQHVSDNAKAFIRACLERDPAKRPSAEQLMEHSWIVQQQQLAAASKSKKKHAKKSPMTKFFQRAFRGGAGHHQ